MNMTTPAPQRQVMAIFPSLGCEAFGLCLVREGNRLTIRVERVASLRDVAAEGEDTFLLRAGGPPLKIGALVPARGCHAIGVRSFRTGGRLILRVYAGESVRTYLLDPEGERITTLRRA